jgi:hypothetical protein
LFRPHPGYGAFHFVGELTMTPAAEALATIEEEAECGLDDWFDEDAADAELQRIMSMYSDILEGENEWNNMQVVNP